MYNKKLANGKVKFYDTYLSLDGKRRQVTVTMNTASSQTQREARKQLDLKIQRKLEEEQAALDLMHNATVKQVFEDYWKIRKFEIAETTAYQESKDYLSFLDDFEFGKRKIKEISSIELQKFVNFFDSYSSKKKYKRYLMQLFEFAFQMRYIDINEALRLRIPKQKVSLATVQKREMKFFTIEEMREFIDGAKLYVKNLVDDYQKKNAYRKLLISEFLFLTGLRFGEMAGLTWENVNILQREIYICASWSANLHKNGTTKNIQSVRYVKLTERAAEILNLMRAEDTNSEFVFVTTGNKPFSSPNFNAFMKKVGEKIQLSGKHASSFSAHMLRHSHITLLVTLGLPQKVIMERVGHSDPKTTSVIYTHVLSEQRHETIQKLENVRLID